MFPVTVTYNLILFVIFSYFGCKQLSWISVANVRLTSKSSSVCMVNLLHLLLRKIKNFRILFIYNFLALLVMNSSSFFKFNQLLTPDSSFASNPGHAQKHSGDRQKETFWGRTNPGHARTDGK